MSGSDLTSGDASGTERGLAFEADLRRALAGRGAELIEPSSEAERATWDEVQKIDILVGRVSGSPHRGAIGIQVSSNPRLGKKRGELMSAGRAVADRLVDIHLTDLRPFQSRESVLFLADLIMSVLRLWPFDRRIRDIRWLGIDVARSFSMNIYNLEEKVAEDTKPVREAIGKRLRGRIHRYRDDKGIGMIEAAVASDGRRFLFFFHLNMCAEAVRARLLARETDFEVWFTNAGYRESGEEYDLPMVRDVSLSQTMEATPPLHETPQNGAPQELGA